MILTEPTITLRAHDHGLDALHYEAALGSWKMDVWVSRTEVIHLKTRESLRELVLRKTMAALNAFHSQVREDRDF